METEKVVPTELELQGLDLSSPEVIELIHHAQESDEADRLLTVRQALKKYKKAVFWAMFLSTSLIMEGYDLVIVSSAVLWNQKAPSLTPHIDNLVLRPTTICRSIRYMG